MVFWAAVEGGGLELEGGVVVVVEAPHEPLIDHERYGLSSQPGLYPVEVGDGLVAQRVGQLRGAHR